MSFWDWMHDIGQRRLKFISAGLGSRFVPEQRLEKARNQGTQSHRQVTQAHAFGYIILPVVPC